MSVELPIRPTCPALRLDKSQHARERNHQGHGVAMCVLRRDLQSVEGWLAQRGIIVGFEDTGQYPAAFLGPTAPSPADSRRSAVRSTKAFRVDPVHQ